MPINGVTTDPKTGAPVVDVAVPKEFPKPETGYKPIAFSTSRALTKGVRDLAQELLGNLPADEFSKLGTPRKPGAPDAPILGILPPLPKVEANPAESVLSSFIQGGLGFALMRRGLRGAAGVAARAPGAAAVAEVAAPARQALSATAARMTQAPGAKGFAGRVAVASIKEAPASVLTGVAAFKPEEQTMADAALRWVEKQAGTPLHNPLLDLVRSSPNDTASQARWKNGVAGLFLDPAANAVVESLGLAARATVNLWRARQAAKPAAEQVVDTTAKAAAEAVAPPPAAEPGKPKGKPRAVEVAEAYEAQRRTPMWEKKGVEVQGKMPMVADPWEPVAKAEADYRQAIDQVETSVARAANTVPDVAGGVRPEARGVDLPAYSQVQETPVADIATDPQRFQFKEAGRLTKTGVSGSLKEAAEYDPLFGKIISVWRDPADGRLYVVNGHNRLALAQRSGRQNILTWEIEAPTAEQARAIGAMENMAEGMGTPWDAAKIMRDMGMDAEQLRQRNINVRGPVAEKAIPLSRLPQDIFDKGVTGKLDMAKAIALGSEPLDEAIIRDVAAAAGKGKWSAEKILQAMQEAKFAQTSGPAGGGVLPGMEDMFKTSNFNQLLDVRTEAFKALREEMIALTSAARPGRKGILEAAGNVIDVAGSQAAREQAAAAVDVFNRVTGYTGPVRDLLNEMAAQVKGRRTAAVVVNENVTRLRQAIEDELQGPRLPLEQPAAAAAPEAPAAVEPAAGTPPPPRAKALPAESAELKALLDKAMANLPAERRAEVLQKMQETAGRGRIMPEEPKGPIPVDPPVGPQNSDDWVRRFARQLETSREALLNGEIIMEDLMANNFQKVQSPSGRTVYTAKREDLVDGLNAMSKVLPDRPTESGIPVFSPEEVRRFNQDWFARHGEDGEAIMAGLKSLTQGFDEYQQGALNRAMAYADKKQVEAAQEAALWLNSANFDGLNESERLARLVAAAEASRATHQAVMRVTRPWGQLGLEMQIPRDYDIPANRNVGTAEIPEAPVRAEATQEIDVDAEIKRELEAEQSKPIEETLTNKIDPELTEAINGGEITPKAQAAADALAQSLVSINADSQARTKFWRSFDDTRNVGPNALLMLRTNNLISGGTTITTNLFNGMLNLARLPLQQAAGAAIQGELKRSMYSLLMYQQYWMNATNAIRTAGHAFKAGQSLFNLEASTVDYLSRVAKQEAQGELMQGPEAMTGWTINTMNMGEEYAKTLPGQVANHVWRVLGTGATRLALTIDTFNSTLAGYAYEHVRHLPRGMELAVERGMKDMSPEAWKWAQQYAAARTEESVKDAVINGKNLADIHMESPQAQKFMDSVNFTDKLWADLEPRTYAEGVRLGQARGLEKQELQDFAKQYVEEGTTLSRVSEWMTQGPLPIGRLGSLPGEAMDSLANARYVGPAFKFIQPFIRVPNNIIKSAARNTPAAAFVDTFWRDIASEDAFTRDRALGEMATGSAVLAMATMASAMGYIRFNGGGPIDPAARQKWTDIEKRMPYSVQFWSDEEGRWVEPISMRAFEPLTTLFGAIGDYADIANNLSTEDRNRLGGSLVLTLARMSTSGVLSKSYFQGFNEIYEAAFNPSKVMTGPNQRNALSRYFSRLAASMVPYSSALRAGRREVDPVTRSVDPSDIGGLMGFFQETLDEVRNAVPGWSDNLPARRDYITGAPILTTGILGAEQIPAELPWLQTLIQFTPMAAVQVGRQLMTPVHEEMARLHGKGTSFSGPRAADFGAEMRLTPSELEDYTLIFATVKDEFGRTFQQSATELIESKQYQSWPIEGPSSRFVSLRAAAIQAEIQRYKELAKNQYKATTAKGQLITQEETVIQADKGEKDYLRRYGGDTTQEQTGAQSWSITPGNR